MLKDLVLSTEVVIDPRVAVKIYSFTIMAEDDGPFNYPLQLNITIGGLDFLILGANDGRQVCYVYLEESKQIELWSSPLAQDMLNGIVDHLQKLLNSRRKSSQSGKKGAAAKHGDSQDKAQKIIQAAQALKDDGVEQDQLIKLLNEDNNNQSLGYHQIRKILIKAKLFKPKKRTKK